MKPTKQNNATEMRTFIWTKQNTIFLSDLHFSKKIDLDLNLDLDLDLDLNLNLETNFKLHFEKLKSYATSGV
jgi:hypothetical protein